MKNPDIVLDELVEADENRRIESLALQRLDEINEDYNRVSTPRMIAEYSRSLQETLVSLSTRESKHPFLHKVKRLGASALGRDHPQVHQEFYLPDLTRTFIEEEPEPGEGYRAELINRMRGRALQRLRNSPPIALVSDPIYETSYIHENQLRHTGLRMVMFGDEHGLFDEDERARKGFIRLDSPVNDSTSITIDRIHEDAATDYYHTSVFATANNQGRITLPESASERSEEEDKMFVLGLLVSFAEHYHVKPATFDPHTQRSGYTVDVPIHGLTRQSFSAWVKI